MHSQQLVSRISSTPLISAVCNRYKSLKEYNSLLKVSIETAESSTHKLLTPVIQILDSNLELDAKAGQVLEMMDRVENKAHEIKCLVTGAVEQGKSFFYKKKKAAVTLFIDVPYNQLVGIGINMIQKNRGCCSFSSSSPVRT